MRAWNQFWSSYFGFNRQQRNGLLVLVMFILILFIIRIGLSGFIKAEPVLVADFSHIQFPETENAAFLSDSSQKRNSLFVFDPNTASKAQLLKLGFKEKLANTLINYRNKGGHFRKKEDLKKVYGMSEAFYKKLEPYILTGNDTQKELSSETPIKNESPPVVKSKKQIELNSADSLTLLTLRGIGPGYTKRILKYRSLLGGFYRVEQVAEIYGMSDSLYQSIKDQLTVNASLIKKVNLNNENFKEVNKHPYLSYEDTKAIFNYRRKNGPIKSTDQVKEIITDAAVFEKLIPYIAFE